MSGFMELLGPGGGFPPSAVGKVRLDSERSRRDVIAPTDEWQTC